MEWGGYLVYMYISTLAGPNTPFWLLTTIAHTQGERSAKALVSEALSQARSLANKRLKGAC
jgi:hypothetical protein